MKQFTTYTDPSGIASTGSKFIVVTVIVSNKDCEGFQKILEKIEKESGKIKKWTDVANKYRFAYVKLLLKDGIFEMSYIYFSVFKNKEDYESLVSAQMAKSILDYADNNKYKATIFLDKVNNRVTKEVTQDIKKYKVHFKKIRALDDTNNVGLKLADAICGLIRDIDNKNVDSSYRQVYKKLREL